MRSGPDLYPGSWRRNRLGESHKSRGARDNSDAAQLPVATNSSGSKSAMVVYCDPYSATCASAHHSTQELLSGYGRADISEITSSANTS
jgi:hypothetical protein